MKWSTKLSKWMRIIHRDLGYLLVGITIIYGISGFLLNHMNGKDPAYHSTESTIKIHQQLNKEELEIHLTELEGMPEVNKILSAGHGFFKIMFDGGIGVYSIETGELSYEFHQKRPFIYYINKLHYNKVKGWTIMGDVFAFSLIFLALSGLIMVKGKNGFKRRGVWLVLVGLAIPILYIVLT